VISASRSAYSIESSHGFLGYLNPPAGEVVWEGGVIERQAADRYVYRSQAHHPLSPVKLTASGERVFSNARDAAAHYLHWDLNLPGSRDGRQVAK